MRNWKLRVVTGSGERGAARHETGDAAGRGETPRVGGPAPSAVRWGLRTGSARFVHSGFLRTKCQRVTDDIRGAWPSGNGSRNVITTRSSEERRRLPLAPRGTRATTLTGAVAVVALGRQAHTSAPAAFAPAGFESQGGSGSRCQGCGAARGVRCASPSPPGRGQCRPPRPCSRAATQSPASRKAPPAACARLCPRPEHAPCMISQDASRRFPTQSGVLKKSCFPVTPWTCLSTVRSLSAWPARPPCPPPTALSPAQATRPPPLATCAFADLGDGDRRAWAPAPCAAAWRTGPASLVQAPLSVPSPCGAVRAREGRGGAGARPPLLWKLLQRLILTCCSIFGSYSLFFPFR